MTHRKLAIPIALCFFLICTTASDSQVTGDLAAWAACQADEKCESLPTKAGKFEYDDGSTYDGEFKDGKVHGHGTYTWSDGTRYDGAFQFGLAQGEGRLTWPSGAVYEGWFHGGEMSGTGTLTWPSGGVYEGEFTGGRVNGYGTLTWPDGLMYSGIFVREEIEGAGVLTWSDGTSYFGSFKSGQINGVGMMVWPSGDSFVGEFSRGAPHGEGTYIWASGARFEGLYQDGLATEGVFYVTEDDGRQLRFSGFQDFRGDWQLEQIPEIVGTWGVVSLATGKTSTIVVHPDGSADLAYEETESTFVSLFWSYNFDSETLIVAIGDDIASWPVRWDGNDKLCTLVAGQCASHWVRVDASVRREPTAPSVGRIAPPGRPTPASP